LFFLKSFSASCRLANLEQMSSVILDL
jgi:hypothetical protein